MPNAGLQDEFGHMTDAELINFYNLEKSLAQRLMQAPRDERLKLYGVVYDTLFSAVPNHPMQVRKTQRTDRLVVPAQARLIGTVLRDGETFLEIGAGDCSLSAQLSTTAGKVYALDVSETIGADHALAPNLTRIITDGISIPLPTASVDVAFSNQLMEHLHPEDAETQLREIRRVLKPSGRYLCVTPSSLSGPHDVSRHFDEVATCLHLREYTYRELTEIFLSAGFKRMSAAIGHQ